MTYPPLPPPTIIDGRMMYTAGDLREYGALCAAIARLDEVSKRDKPPSSMPPGFETLFKGFTKCQ